MLHQNTTKPRNLDTILAVLERHPMVQDALSERAAVELTERRLRVATIEAVREETAPRLSALTASIEVARRDLESARAAEELARSAYERAIGAYAEASMSRDAIIQRNEAALAESADPRIGMFLDELDQYQAELRNMRSGVTEMRGPLDPLTLKREPAKSNLNLLELAAEAIFDARDQARAMLFDTNEDVATRLEGIRSTVRAAIDAAKA